MLVRYLLALLLTVLIEGAVAWLFGYRAGRALLAVSMVNCLTNPALNFLLLFLAWLGVVVRLPLVLLLEGLVVVVEWRLYVYVFEQPKGQLLLLSLMANAASFLAGLLLFWK
jgi:hypothetical protein